jgi:hypothetical protein
MRRIVSPGCSAITSTANQKPPIQGPIDETRLCTWIGQAGIGDTLVYHRGVLAEDRSSTASRLPPRDRAELARVAKRALALAEAGLAELSQRRVGPGDYEYRIAARPRPRGEGSTRCHLMAAILNRLDLAS